MQLISGGMVEQITGFESFCWPLMAVGVGKWHRITHPISHFVVVRFQLAGQGKNTQKQRTWGNFLVVFSWNQDYILPYKVSSYCYL